MSDTPANQLREARIRARLTQAELARLAGTSQSQILRLESGQRRITWEWARRLAPPLNVDPHLLFPGGPVLPQDEPEPPATPSEEVTLLHAELAKLRKHIEVLNDTIKRLTEG